MKPSDSEFIDEVDELLSEAVSCLLDIQDAGSSEPDPEAINGLFRAIHTLKGMAALYGHQCITDLSHGLEDLLDNIRLGKAGMGKQSVDFFFRHIDILRSLVKDVREGKPMDKKHVEACVAEIRSFDETSSKEVKAGEDPLAVLIKGYKDILDVLSEYEEHRLKSNLKSGKGIYKVSVVHSLEDFDTRLKDLTARIKKFGELISTMPTSEGVPVGSIGFTLVLGSKKTEDEVRELTGSEVEVMAGRSGRSGKAAPKAELAGKALHSIAEQEQTLKTVSTTVRVDIEKLDRLLNTVGEISLVKSNTRKLWARMSETFGQSPLVIELYKQVQYMERRLHELQENVLEIRMVPIGQIFSRLGQVVRRYAKISGKEINLTFFGEDTEIDKFLAEEVVDPLMHIVRNAIDHGLEKPAERKSKGKPEAGSLELRARQKGNNVVIEISDDGRGIDMGKVKRRAVQRGMVTASEQLEEKDILEFMFEAGFSTKDTVSETSGRGVGLDVVKLMLASLGGFVEVSTEPGKGTVFTLTLPITLAIVKSLMVRLGRETFAMPLSSMNETFDFNRKSIQHLEGGDVYNLRGEMLPVAALDRILHIDSDNNEDAYAVIVGHGEKRIGLVVDELLHQQEIVIKPLGDYFEGVSGFAGATEVGSDEVVLVLDAEALLAEAFEKKKAQEK
ncbi:MAG TPA: chemotaxis protein CheA [Nitrospirae bacterium]|nr:chemotaxis protein CheA [Nitrospirota bacterium]